MANIPPEQEIMASWPKDGQVMVSVMCATFQHVGLVEKAIAGFLGQQTNFVFEVIIHDDASTDGTARIIERFAKDYPRIIRTVLQTDNQYSKGVKPFSSIMMPMSRGRYIAK